MSAAAPVYVPIYCAELARDDANYANPYRRKQRCRRKEEAGTLGRAYAVQRDGEWRCGYCRGSVKVAWFEVSMAGDRSSLDGSSAVTGRR